MFCATHHFDLDVLCYEIKDVIQYNIAHVHLCVWVRFGVNIYFWSLGSMHKIVVNTKCYTIYNNHDHGRNENDFFILIWLIYIIYAKTLKRYTFWNFSSNDDWWRRIIILRMPYFTSHYFSPKIFIHITKIRIHSVDTCIHLKFICMDKI